MAYIKENWVNKEERAEIARAKAAKNEVEFGKEIKECVDNTITYDDSLKRNPDLFTGKEVNVRVENLDSVSAILKHIDGTTAVLNFASYKHPGGMFLNGSKAQEECLCHSSILYNVLRNFEQSYYLWNKNNKNKALYLNRALYSREVPFFKESSIRSTKRSKETVKCDVITCAAPNKTTAQKFRRVTDEDNYEALESRIEFILNIAEMEQVKTLILGAFGCGVFGQDPEEVARIFRDRLVGRNFKKVIFAIPMGRDENYNVFRKVFQG